ncbi:MAG: neutral/alkaline non-lysosomal ceramidase N-terminal domain-containing protein, partial [Pseudobdellovibrionaceae bacterium]|nr:neutral/alkaline non-lysosomal ceramidase N-terminal domain-containing protein [Pseudobdellovibrionaceae bacterium]
MRILSGLLPASLLFATTPLLAEQLCPSPPGQPAAYKIGLSQLSITPMNKLTIAGYGTYYGLPSATRMSHEGTHDPIFASTFWVETDTERALAIVALDLVGISRPTVLRVEEEVKRTLGRSNVHVILSATHTHHAPDVLGLWGALPFFTGRDEPYMNFLEKSIVASIKSASDTARCSQVHWAETHKETDWHNYLPAGSEHEETITTLSFVDPLTQQSLGTLTQWAAHPTVLEANNNTISSDFPGAFRTAMGGFRDGIHIYVNGMLGASYIPLKDTDRRPDPFVNGDKDPDVT